MHDNDRTGKRSFSILIAETRDEIKKFAKTRLQLLQSELKDKTKTLKVAAPLASAGTMLLGTSYLLWTFALVALVGTLLRNTLFGWFYAFGMLAVFYLFIGGAAIYVAVRELKSKPWAPIRTIKILKSDVRWIKTEAKERI